MKVIIIEDEARAARDLKKMLEDIDTGIEVLAILPSVHLATTWLRENQAPDLIFSDIQLGDGLSFEIFKTVKTAIPVIFCTAFDQYAIKAFEANSIEYLLKPVGEETLENSLQKFDRLKQHFNGSLQQYNQNLNNVLVQFEKSYKKTLLVHFREKLIPVKVQDICCIASSGGIVSLYTIHELVYPVQYTMEQLEQTLDPEMFFKANRQFLINRNAIQNVEHYFNRRLFVKLICSTSEKIIISKVKAQEFIRWIEC